MTKEQLKTILSSITAVCEDKDGDLFIKLARDDEYNHDVVIYFILSGGGAKLQMLGMTNFKPNVGRSSALEVCNEWNSEKSFGQAYVTKDMEFRINAAVDNPGDLPREYVATSVVQFYLAAFWMFFTFVGSKFDRIGQFTI